MSEALSGERPTGEAVRFSNLPNLISASRFPLLSVVVALFYVGTPPARVGAVPLLFVLMMGDLVDGYLARRLRVQSLLGSVLDIAADRAVEQVMWFVLADLDLIPVVIPALIIPRGILTDAIRAIAVNRGTTPFGMMRSRLGRWLVQSPPMRTGSSVVNSGAFLGLTVAYAAEGLGLPHEGLYAAGLAFSWFGLLFSLARGLPVIVEGYAFLSRPETA